MPEEAHKERAGRANGRKRTFFNFFLTCGSDGQIGSVAHGIRLRIFAVYVFVVIHSCCTLYVSVTHANLP